MTERADAERRDGDLELAFDDGYQVGYAAALAAARAALEDLVDDATREGRDEGLALRAIELIDALAAGAQEDGNG